MKIIRWAVAGVGICFLLLTFIVIRDKIHADAAAAGSLLVGSLLAGVYVVFLVFILGQVALGLINWAKTGDLEPAKAVLMKMVNDLTGNTHPQQLLQPLTKKQVILYSIALGATISLAVYVKEKGRESEDRARSEYQKRIEEITNAQEAQEARHKAQFNAASRAPTVRGNPYYSDKSSPSESEKKAAFRQMESQMRSSFGSLPRRIDAFTVLENVSFNESEYTVFIQKKFDSIKDGKSFDSYELRSYFQTIGETYCQKKSGNLLNVDSSWVVFHETVVNLNGLLIGGVTTRGLGESCQIEIQLAP